MIKYNLLILDDSIKTREFSYRKLLEPTFNIFFHDDSSNLSVVDDPNIHAILLDMVWEIGDDESVKNKELHQLENNFVTILKYIKRKKPVILVSRYFSEIASWISHTKDPQVDVIDFIGWPELFHVDGNVKSESLIHTTKFRLQYSINNYYNKTQSKKDADESIFILCISDLQYEDPDFYKKNKLASYGKIFEKIYQKGIKQVDILMVLGDISYSGRKSQFEEANNWLNKLIDMLFKDIDSKHERIIMIPGNHDVNLCVSASEFYDFNWDNKDSKYLIDSKSLKQDKFGLLPFSNFAYKITKDLNFLHHSKNYNWINDKFTNWGLRIVQLNTATSIDYKRPQFFDLDQNSLELLMDEFVLNKTDLFTITIAHNSPENLGFSFTDDEQSDQRIINLLELLKTSKTNLYIHGHHHNFKEYELQNITETKFLANGTLNVRKNNKLSFTIIELKRKDHKVISFNPICIDLS